MIRIDLTQLMPGDIIALRSLTSYGKLIRAVLGSYTNHNGLAIRKEGCWYIGEAVEPISRLTTVHAYEAEVNAGAKLRVWRVPNVTPEIREQVARYFMEHLIGKKYPLSVVRLWVFRFVNSLPWEIRGDWCTRLVWDAWGTVGPEIFDRPDGKRKKNPTPRTLENRLVAGIIRDVTDQIVVSSTL